MAIDTRSKRAAGLSFLQVGRLPFPLPDGTVDQIDRVQMAGGYGLVTPEPPVTTPMRIYRTINLEIV